MRSVSIRKPGVVEIRETSVPRPGSGEVLIRVEASGICGTDVHIYKGEYLGSYPIVPGHEGAGTVAEVGEGISDIKAGDPVAFEPNISCGVCGHCLNNRQNFCENWAGIGVTSPGCMAEYVLAPRTNVFPTSGLEPEVACFMEPLSCVLHGIQKAGVRLGDRVLIAGAGPIGLLLLQAVKNLGAARIDTVERVASRRNDALGFGAHTALTDPAEAEHDFYDVVIDATGAIPVLEQLISHVRYGGSMLFFGVAPSGKAMTIEPFLIFRKGLTIVSSYTSLKNSLQAIDMLGSGGIRVDGLVSHEFGLEGFEGGIELIETGGENVKKVVIKPTA